MNVPIRKKPKEVREAEAPELARRYYRYFRGKGETKETAKIIVRNIIKVVVNL